MFDPRTLALCLVTDPDLVPPGALVDTVTAAVRGGVTMVQLRDKHASDDVLVEQATALLHLLRPLGIPLLVNDRVDVAVRAGADGVHLGQDDESPASARARLAPGSIVGLSITHASQLAAAAGTPVDYYGVGPCYATATKPGHDPALGLHAVQALVAAGDRPCIAIGGISAERAAAVMATGVAGLAVVSAICGHPDPERAARALALHASPPARRLAVSSPLEVLS